MIRAPYGKTLICRTHDMITATQPQLYIEKHFKEIDQSFKHIKDLKF